jgi:hypothetical protein
MKKFFISVFNFSFASSALAFTASLTDVAPQIHTSSHGRLIEVWASQIDDADGKEIHFWTSASGSAAAANAVCDLTRPWSAINDYGVICIAK